MRGIVRLSIAVVIMLTVSPAQASWIVEVVDDVGMIGLSSSIAVDSSDHPHITYSDGNVLRFKYAYSTTEGYAIFADGFETGDVSGWDSSAP
ncbi:MAG: hypothetical protein ABFS37_00225 [Acidobacteriota bacterium]